MEKIIFEASNDCPLIILDGKQGHVFVGGSSLPENVFDIYTPVLNWLDEYTIQPNPETKVDFFFDYLNTASSHMIMRIFEKLIQLSTACPGLSINWHYIKSDLDMRDFGEELLELSKIPVNLIAEENLPLSME